MASVDKIIKSLLEYAAENNATLSAKALKAIDGRIKELSDCGLDNDRVIADLIKKDISFVGKEALLNRRPRTVKAELYDKINYMCRAYMDRMERIEFEYDFTIDEKAFKTVIIGLLEAAPVLRSRFVANPVSPYWKPVAYNIDEVVTCSHGDFSKEKVYEFMSQEIPVSSNTQMKIHLFFHDGKTYVCYLINHMCMDGGGIFTMIPDICRNYTKFTADGISPTDFKSGPRSEEELYADMTPETKRKAKKLFSNITPKIKCDFPYTKKSKTDRTILIRRTFSQECFKPTLGVAKKLGCTGNDVLIAAYMTAYKELTNSSAERALNVTTAIDLRRHVKDPDRLGYTNLLSFFNCTVEHTGNSVHDTLLAVRDATMPIKTDPLIGLTGLPLLSAAYKTMVYVQAEQIIKRFYSNPSLSVSNLGALDMKAFSFSGNEPTYTCVAGAAKNKPCAVMTCVGFKGVLTAAISLYGNDEDYRLLERFFDLFEKALYDLAQ